MGKRGAEPQGGDGKKKRKYLDNGSQFAKGSALPQGKQGILITLETGDVRKGAREALIVLKDAYEALAPAGGVGTEDVAEPDADGDDADGEQEAAPDATDFSSLIADEVTTLKDRKKQPFRLHDTGIRTCLFIEMPWAARPGQPGPLEVTSRIMQQAKATQVLQFRHCARFLPCTHICRANKADIEALAAKALPALMDCTPEAKKESVAVLYEHRAAPQELKRMEVIDAVVAAVPRPPHEVKLKGASKTISVQIVRNACGIALLPDYHELFKYNVKTICQGGPKKEEGKAVAGDGKPAKAAALSDAPAQQEAGKPATKADQVEGKGAAKDSAKSEAE